MKWKLRDNSKPAAKECDGNIPYEFGDFGSVLKETVRMTVRISMENGSTKCVSNPLRDIWCNDLIIRSIDYD